MSKNNIFQAVHLRKGKQKESSQLSQKWNQLILTCKIVAFYEFRSLERVRGELIVAQYKVEIG